MAQITPEDEIIYESSGRIIRLEEAQNGGAVWLILPGLLIVIVIILAILGKLS